MFKGLTSMLFGYSDSEAQIDEKLENSLTDETAGKTIEKSRSNNDTSALLEQTLNAATTKLTEQLIPQSQSIEQLQSSSHQLLPTLIEQHEEDESKRRQKQQIEEQEESKTGDIDDDECFNADSWELLDLVDKPEAATSLNSTVQDKYVAGYSSAKQTSGILKQSNAALSSSSNQHEDSTNQGQRQRPKVSFETPDLVTDKEEKIEPIAPKDNDNKVKSKSSRSGNKKKNKQTKAAVSTSAAGGSVTGKTAASIPSPSSGGVSGTTEKLRSAQNDTSILSIEQKQQLVAPSNSQKSPVLNYAAALTSVKLNKETNRGKDLKKPFNEICAQAVINNDEGEFKKPATSPSAVGAGLQSGGAIKRNRPVSTSSWSSSDEIETINSIWNDNPTSGQPKSDEKQQQLQKLRSKVDQVFDGDDDNESIISSGFSDCDYGYHCMNDYVMRPKKLQNKRRGPSNSSSLLSSMSKRGSDRAAEQQQQQQQEGNKRSSNIMENSGRRTSVSLKQEQKVSPSPKNIKPKKKKMVLSPDSSSSDFLKQKQLSSSVVSEEAKHATTGYGVRATFDDILPTNSDSSIAIVGTQQPLQHHQMMMLPPASATITSSSSTSVNDSSDIADMDESWFVTPPPCFTGSNKISKISKANKEAARENALIEHPSIYIASTSEQQQVLPATVAAAAAATINSGNSKRSNAADSLIKQKAIVVLKKVNKQTIAPTAPPATSEKSSKLAAAAPAKPEATQHSKSSTKKGAKQSWENKFIVTNWNFDEQDDLNDFDNLFQADSLTSPKTSKRQSKAKKQKAPKVIKDMESGDGGCAMPSLVYESDFSLTSPALVGVTGDNSSDILSVADMVKVIDADLELSSLEAAAADENLPPVPPSEASSVDEMLKLDGEKLIRERKAPVQVRPIEPERQPGWQLRRKRCKRRPLSATIVNTAYGSLVDGAAKQPRMLSSNHNSKGPASATSGDQQVHQAGSGQSGSSSARSTPTLMDRIGSSIVANLTNLTSGFPASGALPMQARASMEEAVASQTAVRKSNSEFNLVARRRMSKGYLDRQNDCARVGNSLRRADRRLKMHTTPNGSSVNRKVHASFH